MLWVVSKKREEKKMKLKAGAPFLRSTREDPFPFGGYDFREENETAESEKHVRIVYLSFSQQPNRALSLNE